SEQSRHLLNEGSISLGYEPALTDVMFSGPEETLRDTANAQPAIYLHEIALTRARANRRIKPSIVAGHSVGEYAALTAANVLDFGHALWLIAQRGQLMSEAGRMSPGSMAAVLGLDDAEVERCCRE